MIISRTRLANGATLTKLRPVEPAPLNSEVTARHSRGKRLVRIDDMGITLALDDYEYQNFSRCHTSMGRGPKEG